jgi:hypothetical protein
MSIGAEPPLAEAEEIFRLAQGHGFGVYVPQAEPVKPVEWVSPDWLPAAMLATGA